LLLLALQISISKGSIKPPCNWNDTLEENVVIEFCEAQTIDPNFLSNSNGNKNTVLDNLRITTQLTSIKDYTFNTAINMEWLNLSNNKIMDIEEKAFSGLRNLKSLVLENNNIQNLKKKLFVELTVLIQVSLGQNKLTTFDFEIFKKNPKLVYLKISNNNITHFATISTSFQLDLKVLSIERNRIRTLSFKNLPNLPKLETLYMDVNELTELEFDKIKKQLPELITIHLKKNLWDCFYLAEMIAGLKTQFPQLNMDCDPLKDMKNFQIQSKCLRCTKSIDNLIQIKSFEPQKKSISGYPWMKISLLVGLFAIEIIMGYYAFYVM
jgi:Leucine-rich repeat (LRR) protein